MQREVMRRVALGIRLRGAFMLGLAALGLAFAQSQLRQELLEAKLSGKASIDIL